jgi:hypothetical protein
MSGASKTFKQADLERAIRAARACDLPIFRSEVTRDGRIILVHFDAPIGLETPTNDNTPPNEWDEYFEEQG